MLKTYFPPSLSLPRMKQLPPGSPKNGMLPSTEHRAQGTGRRAQGTGRRAQSKRLRDEGTARLQDNVSCIIGDVPHWKRPARLARPARPA